MLLEQNQAEQKKIAKYKKEGYQSLTQAAWKKKKTNDSSGQFVNVGTYFYGYIPSKSVNKDAKPSKQDNKPGQQDNTTAQQDNTTVKKDDTPIQQPLKPKTIDCNDIWDDSENFFTRYNEGEENESAIRFLDWATSKFPNLLQSGGKYLGQCGLIFPNSPYVDLKKQDLYNNPVLKKIALQQVGTAKGYMSRVEYWFNYVERASLPTDSPVVKKDDTKVADTPTNKIDTDVKTTNPDTRLVKLYKQVDFLTNVSGINTRTDIETVSLSKSSCDSLLDDYTSLYDIFRNDFKSTGYDRKEFAANQTGAKKLLYFCYKKYSKKYSKDPKFQNIMNVTPDWNVNISDLSKNKVNESSLMESVIKKLKNKKDMKNLTESVRNKLVKTKMKKRIQEESLKVKLALLSEEFKNKNYSNLFNKLTLECNNPKKILSEAESVSLEKSVKRLFSGNESKLKEKVVTHILSKLKLSENTEIYNKIKTELESTSDDQMIRLITDCNFTAGKIVNSLPETLLSQLKNNGGEESLAGIVKMSMANSINDKNLIDDIKYKVSQLICPSLKELESKIGKESESLIGKYLSSES
jgi:hypothetical protein